MQFKIKNSDSQKIKRTCKDALGALTLAVFLGACQSTLDKPVSPDLGLKKGISMETAAVISPAVDSSNEIKPVEIPIKTKMVLSSGGTNSLLGNSHEQELRNFIARVGNWHSVERVRVVGHTDNTGSNEDNEKLSIKRAWAVADKLATMGLNKPLYQVEGMGELEPVADNDTRQGRAENRRVEIEVEGVELKTAAQVAVKAK